MSDLFHEPYKTLNGVTLTTGQAMTLRVALEAFAVSLSLEGLGNDEHGKAMTDGYLKQIASIRRLGMES